MKTGIAASYKISFFLLELKLLIQVTLPGLHPSELLLFFSTDEISFVGKDDVLCLARIVPYSQAQRRYSRQCNHLHSSLLSQRTFCIQFDSATVRWFLFRAVLLLLVLCLLTARGSNTGNAAINSLSVLTMCTVTVRFSCLVESSQLW